MCLSRYHCPVERSHQFWYFFVFFRVTTPCGIQTDTRTDGQTDRRTDGQEAHAITRLHNKTMLCKPYLWRLELFDFFLLFRQVFRTFSNSEINSFELHNYHDANLFCRRRFPGRIRRPPTSLARSWRTARPAIVCQTAACRRAGHRRNYGTVLPRCRPADARRSQADAFPQIRDSLSRRRPPRRTGRHSNRLRTRSGTANFSDEQTEQTKEWMNEWMKHHETSLFSVAANQIIYHATTFIFT